jgi:hypothetical protein
MLEPKGCRMKLISIDTSWGTHDTFVIEKNNVVYCVEINNYSDNNEVREMYRERKIRKDSKLHAALCIFAESQRKLTPA